MIILNKPKRIPDFNENEIIYQNKEQNFYIIQPQNKPKSSNIYRTVIETTIEDETKIDKIVSDIAIFYKMRLQELEDELTSSSPDIEIPKNKYIKILFIAARLKQVIEYKLIIRSNITTDEIQLNKSTYIEQNEIYNYPLKYELPIYNLKHCRYDESFDPVACCFHDAKEAQGRILYVDDYYIETNTGKIPSTLILDGYNPEDCLNKIIYNEFTLLFDDAYISLDTGKNNYIIDQNTTQNINLVLEKQIVNLELDIKEKK